MDGTASGDGKEVVPDAVAAARPVVPIERTERPDEPGTRVERIAYGRIRGGATPPHPDKVRQQIAVWLLAVLSGTILLSIFLMGFGHLWGMPTAETRLFLEIVFTAVVTMVSSAVGFYFGQRSRNDMRNGGDDG